MMGVGAGLRVIEIAGGPAAGFAGMLLASLGADVIRIEDPDGESFQAGETAPIDGSTAMFLHRRKRRASISLSTSEGRRAFRALLGTTDGLIEDLGVSRASELRLVGRTLRRGRRNLVVASISPFGSKGSRAEWEASELVVQAMGGIVHSTGFEGEPGLKVAGMPAHFIAGLHAATAVLAGVAGVRLGTEPGAHIEISMEEAWMHHWVRHIQEWGHTGFGMQREQRGTGRQGFPHTVMAADDWLYVLALNADWEPFAVFMGLEEFVGRQWSGAKTQIEGWDEIEPTYRRSVASKSRYEWFAEAAGRGYTFAPIHTVAQLADTPQYRAREAFEPLAREPLAILVPDLPFRVDSAGRRPNRTAAAGEDTRDVLDEAGVEPTAVGRILRRPSHGGDS